MAMNLELASWRLPWHEIWFPINAGTVPAHCLMFLWGLGIVFFFVHPKLRTRLLRSYLIILIGYPAAMTWSLSYRILGGGWTFSNPELGVSSPNYDPRVWLMDAGTQTVGLLAVFLIMWLTSGVLFIISPLNSKAEQASTSNGG